jgi:glyoxylate carboligase
MGGKDYANQTCSTQQRLKIHVKQVRSITCPNIRLGKPSKILRTIVVPVQNPIAHHRSLALSSFILDELVSQIIHGLPSQNVGQREKLKKVGNDAQGRPTLLTITKGG